MLNTVKRPRHQRHRPTVRYSGAKSLRGEHREGVIRNYHRALRHNTLEGALCCARRYNRLLVGLKLRLVVLS